MSSAGALATLWTLTIAGLVLGPVHGVALVAVLLLVVLCWVHHELALRDETRELLQRRAQERR